MARKLLSRIYGCATRLRNVAYDRGIAPRHRAPVPVVSIGNVTAGGNGKTPLAIFLAREMGRRGWRPVVVTRGYGGTVVGPHQVGADDSPRSVGDEPCLMAQHHGIVVVVARDRVRGAEFVARQGLGDLVILDDGFQHRRLERDVDIVTINVGSAEARAAFVKGDLLPLGMFREDRQRALRRADIVVCAERRPDPGGAAPAEVLSCLPRHVTVYRSFLTPLPVVAHTDRTRSLPPGNVVAFCAIANPENFFMTLESAGFSLVGKRVFSDHYHFSESDIATLRREYPGVPLVCTEKDSLKLGGTSEDIFILGIETKVYPSDAFLSQIDRKLREPRKGTV
jgi:tetraacyldisaccharide 4'-kinase